MTSLDCQLFVGILALVAKLSKSEENDSHTEDNFACYKCLWLPKYAEIPVSDQTVTDVQSQLVHQGGLWLIDRGLADPKIFEMPDCGDPFNNKKIYPLHATCHSECVKLKLRGTFNGSELGIVARGCRDEIEENSRSQVYDAVRNDSGCFAFQLTSKHSKIFLDGTVCLCLGNLCNSAPQQYLLDSMLILFIVVVVVVVTIQFD